jgi:uncharacterized membrane protein YcaP (DUF421 family)
MSDFSLGVFRFRSNHQDKGGKVMEDNLRRELFSHRELRSLLRRQGIQRLDEIEEAVLESDGFVSVIRKSDEKNVSQNS